MDNLNYVIRNSDPGFSLLPEVYLQKGEALDKLGQRDEAVAEYRNALRAKADYTPAYAALAQHYIDRGDVDAARGVIEQGLKRDPGSTALAAKKAALAERD